jgi:hypothetical protein
MISAGLSVVATATPLVTSHVMKRPARFAEHRYVGDKRTQLVYDVDAWDQPVVVNEFVDLGVGIGFSPDTLGEARNRGYRLATRGAGRVIRASRS